MQIDRIVLAATAVIKKDNKLLLLKRSENEESYAGFWQPPEGHIESDENPEVAVKREVKEEIGLEFKNCKYVGTNGFIYNLEKGNILGIRILFDGNIEGEVVLSSEHSEYKWFSKEEFINSDKIVPGTIDQLKDYLG